MMAFNHIYRRSIINKLNDGFSTDCVFLQRKTDSVQEIYPQ